MGFLLDWLRDNPQPTATPAPVQTVTVSTGPTNQYVAEAKMAIEIEGIYYRVKKEFPTIQAKEEVKTWIGKHPYTIISMFQKEYVALFGQEEYEILKKSYVDKKFNMAMTYTREWIQGDNVQQVPIPPKVQPALKPGYVWQDVGFGQRQVPAGQAFANVNVVGISDEVLHQIAAHVYEMWQTALNNTANKG